MNSFVVLAIFHVIGDFYLQSDKVAKKKRNLNTFMLTHSLIYAIPFLMIFLSFKTGVLFSIIIIISHALIDICSVQFKNKYKEKECVIFSIDQGLHVIIIYYCSFFMNTQKIMTNELLVLLLSVLILIKPTSIFISLVFKSIFKDEKSNNDLKIGRYIGYLERIIIFILCIFNSISTIGFVIAAKTLVRYKDINDNNVLKEYMIKGYAINERHMAMLNNTNPI